MSEALGTFQRLQVFQAVNREWRGHLSITERDFLSYLIDSSVSYGREWVQVTVDQMLAGTEWGLHPVGLSRRSVFNVITSLKKKGVLAIQKVSRKVNRYIVNLKWNPAMGLATPKSKVNPGTDGKKTGLAVGKKRAESTVHDMHREAKSECISCTPKIDSKPKEKDSNPALDAPSGLSGSEVVKAIKDRTTARLRQSAELSDVWTRAWIEGKHAAGAPGLTKKTRGQLRHIVKRFPEGLKIIEWGVANWHGVIARQFAWMTRVPPPSLPDTGFLLKYATAFAEDFATAEDRRTRWDKPAEQREFERLLKSGVSYEDALLQVGKSRAVADERGELAKTKEQLRKEQEAVRLERQQLDQQRRAMKPSRPAEKTEKPTLNHGDNPWENGGGEVADFSDLGEWSDDA